MCLIGLAYRCHPDYPLVLAANRDEFYARPAAAAAYWTDAPRVYGGRDLTQGGSWLALSHRRRLAAVTNVRRMQPPLAAAPSRGALVAEFVRGTHHAMAFAQALGENSGEYAGFNLLLWDGAELLYLTNQPQFLVERIAPGVHGLSNAALNTPWPKLRRLREGMQRWVAARQQAEAPLFELLADEQPADDAELPGTGLPRDTERLLSAPFIRSEAYGTRASSVLRIGSSAAQFSERRFGSEGVELGRSTQQLLF